MSFIPYSLPIRTLTTFLPGSTATRTHYKVRAALRAAIRSCFTILLLARIAPFAAAQAAEQQAEMPRALPNKVAGRRIEIKSANPATFAQIITHAAFDPVTISGWLYEPDRHTRGAVIIVPGSAGLSSALVAYAQALTTDALTVFVIDSFSARGISSTAANQNALSFASQAYDLLAAVRALRTTADVDPKRIGVVGISRGGAAALLAATNVVSVAALGDEAPFRAILAAWPWCGYQLLAPITPATSVRFLVADRDDWASPVQCQAWATALRASGRRVSIRMFRDAGHGFGMDSDVVLAPTAIKALDAPIIYLDDQGRFIDWYKEEASPVPDDEFLRQKLAPWLAKGAHVGSRPGERDAFLADMRGFFQNELRN